MPHAHRTGYEGQREKVRETDLPLASAIKLIDQSALLSVLVQHASLIITSRYTLLITQRVEIQISSMNCRVGRYIVEFYMPQHTKDKAPT